MIHSKPGLSSETVKQDAVLIREEIKRLSAELKIAQTMLRAVYDICGHPNARHGGSRMDCSDCGYGEYYGD